jgi:FdhD protein
MAGIPFLAAVSAPSSLAVELGSEIGLTVVGFLRGNSMVVYSGSQRVAESVPSVLSGEKVSAG